jgi:hypothetical protein
MFAVYRKAVAIILGVLWCGAILRRLPQDLVDLRRAEHWGDRVVIVVLWAITAAVVIGLIWLIRPIVRANIQFFGH